MKTMRLLLVIALVFPGFFLTTCSQEPLFYYIHLEYPPIEPIIGGAPTEIVERGNVVYVANRTSLWKYDMTTLDPILNVPIWEPVEPKPSGAILAIAATSADLYVLVEGGTIHKFDGTDWDSTTVHVSGAQKIYGANNTLFAGDGSAVYVCDFALSKVTKITGTDVPGGLLRGAAWDGTNYYICTANVKGGENTGIFQLDGSINVISKYPGSVKGIIATGSAIVAVTDNTIIYKNSLVNFDSPIPSASFTGGMALWEWTDSSSITHKKILLGLQRGGGGTFRYGYRELDLDGSGNVVNGGVYAPGTTNGNRTTSIDPGSTQTSAIGKYPVNALYVVPNTSPNPNSEDNQKRPIIFASTQQNGVWSYRVRRGTPQWNGEDNNTR